MDTLQMESRPMFALQTLDIYHLVIRYLDKKSKRNLAWVCQRFISYKLYTLIDVKDEIIKHENPVLFDEWVGWGGGLNEIYQHKYYYFCNMDIDNLKCNIPIPAYHYFPLIRYVLHYIVTDDNFKEIHPHVFRKQTNCYHHSKYI